jgi:hypothetical protein
MAPIDLKHEKKTIFYFSPQIAIEIEFGGVKNTTIQEIEISHLGTLKIYVRFVCNSILWAENGSAQRNLHFG